MMNELDTLFGTVGCILSIFGLLAGILISAKWVLVVMVLGLLMMGGKLIILGDVTDDVGESIMRGSIFVLGDVKSLGKNAAMDKITPDDQKELKEILTKYGFELTDNDYSNFKKIVNIQ